MSTHRIRDAATFEVFRNAVTGLADEMAITILRTAHSQIVASSMDFSAALCDASGRVIAQANTCPVHLGSIPEAMTAVLDAFGDTVRPGDVYLLNDPDLGGMHLPDIFAIAPVFTDERELLGYSVTVVNHADVGGWAAGSMAVQSTSIFAEGVQIPPSRLAEAGTLNETFLALILRNVREPALLRGDLDAQLAACHAGGEGLKALARRHGGARLATLNDELLDYSETLLRAALAEAPDGTYAFEDHIDDDGLGSPPIPFRVTVTIAGDSVQLDFTGSSPQVASALNATTSFTKSASYAAVQGALGSDVPANSGFYRPFTFVIPEASILNGRRPSARGARGLVAYRIIDTVLGALAPVFPHHVPAAGDGGPDSIAIGVIGEDGSSAVLWDILCGAWGARPDRDGVDGISPLGANLANTPIEELEQSGHLRVDGYGYLPDTGGPGTWRGGLSTFRDMTFLHHETSVQIRSDRRTHLPYGLQGGAPGTPSSNILNGGTPQEQILPSKVVQTLHAGDRHRHTTAGGGGHGDPFTREADRVLHDVLDEKVTVAGAARDYGVVITPGGAVDAVATRELRSGPPDGPVPPRSPTPEQPPVLSEVATMAKVTVPTSTEQSMSRLWRKVGVRIIPFIGVAYVMSYIDRANLGYMAEPLSKDLDISSTQMGLASGLFFIGYVLVEVPSNMMLRRFGARRWITRILLTWGVTTMATAAVQNAGELYAMRILLGFAEAGLAAGILLYMTFWFPRRYRAWAMSAFFMMIPLSGIIGSPLAAALLSWGKSLTGLAGWRSLFLVEGSLTLLVGILVFTLLPDHPDDAKWLTAAEKEAIGRRLAQETADQDAHGAISGVRQTLSSGRVWALALAFFAVVFGLYPIAFFLPTMISTLTDNISGASNISSVLLAGIPSAIAIIAMLTWPKIATRRSAVFSTVVPMILGIVGLLLATFTRNNVLFIVAFCLSVSGIYTAMPQFWRLPPLCLTGAAAASGIALINSVSNISGFIGPYMTGAIASSTGSYTYALLTIALIMTAGVAILLTAGRRAEQVGEGQRQHPRLREEEKIA
ncbi:MAG: MFS transporter [Actinoallomurus sp.]